MLGPRGQLGSALRSQLARDPAAQLLGSAELDALDICDAAGFERALSALPRPAQVVVNAAAFTQVDRCEREAERAWRINAEAPARLAERCVRHGALFVHLSTDYVFDGVGGGSGPGGSYRESDPVNPLSSYGRSKLGGETGVRAVAPDSLIVRTSWVYGRGRNFVAAMLEQARRVRAGELDPPLRVVDDQRGRPTHAGDLAQGLRGLVERGARGLYHLAGGGEASWWDLARAALDLRGCADIPIRAIRTAELDVAAPRPLRALLDCSRAAALGVELRDWRVALRDFLASPDAPPEPRMPR